VLLTSGSESAFIGSLRPPGEDGPRIDDGRAGDNDAAQNPVLPETNTGDDPQLCVLF